MWLALPVLRGNVDHFQLCQNCQRCWKPIELEAGGQVFTQITLDIAGMRVILRMESDNGKYKGTWPWKTCFFKMITMMMMMMMMMMVMMMMVMTVSLNAFILYSGGKHFLGRSYTHWTLWSLTDSATSPLYVFPWNEK